MRSTAIRSIVEDEKGRIFAATGMELTKYSEYQLKLTKGNKIFLYTYGVPETTNSSNEMLNTDRMIDALNKKASVNPEMTIHNVIEAVNDFVKDVEQFDDLTTLCLEYKSKD